MQLARGQAVIAASPQGDAVVQLKVVGGTGLEESARLE